MRFTRYGRLYYLDPGPYRPRVGEKVLVPTEDGPEVAECVWAPQTVSEEIGYLPCIAGIAGETDLARDAQHRRRRLEATRVVRNAVRRHGLAMKVVAIDYVDSGDRQLFTVYFSAPVRVDFRDLVRELVRALSARVELRQLSARDQAKVQGGIGPCGRDLCCATFLPDFEPVSLRMAKDQDLPLNPLKISGACGKLLCCLRYEHPLYREFKAAVPQVGAEVSTPDGDGTVVGYTVPAGTVQVRLASGQRVSCPRAGACESRRPRRRRRAASVGDSVAEPEAT